MQIQKIENVHAGKRIETGPLKIGGDWTGCYLRGDYAIDLGIKLGIILSHLDKHVDNNPNLQFAIMALEELMDLCMEVVEK